MMIYVVLNKSIDDVQKALKKIKFSLNTNRRITLYSFFPLINLMGNKKIIELRKNFTNNDFVVKVEGPDFLIEALDEIFKKGYTF